jgi:hypothetical protein
MCRHGRDDEARAAVGDHAAEFLEHERGADEVDGEDLPRGRLHRETPAVWTNVVWRAA